MKDSNKIALYVHIPFCSAKCSYCGFYSEPLAGFDVEKLVFCLIAEMEYYKIGENIETVYIGGGSPSCLPRKQLFQLIGEINNRCRNIKEFTIELNPNQCDTELFNQLHRNYVNRLSIGAQSFVQSELDFLGRNCYAECIAETITRAHSAGFNNISLDLIFAIPASTMKSWLHNLDSAIISGVQHISAYSLTYEKQTPLQKMVDTGKVTPIDEDTDRNMYELAIDKLTSAGFGQYEISNFAKKGFQCKHNLVYWSNQQYIGIGPSAASYYNGKRTTNIADIERYIECGEIVESEIPKDIEIACETAVLNLRRIRGINLAQFKEQTGFDAAKIFAEPIERYLKMGLMKKNNNAVSLTRSALPIADSVLTDFSAI